MTVLLIVTIEHQAKEIRLCLGHWGSVGGFGAGEGHDLIHI